ncbi:hypothetical protein SSCH_320002 [Syntrophaceticus schinkii]|uniref:Integrase catalytic domain-containing protein n=1 Tax=Syntrophaceticus schinkii TaxID=499207 RepID=A0A0B7MFX0_9FIRM|nr:hypothetical protein SSCH_320002 [Syntrophaceticus schinkii]
MNKSFVLNWLKRALSYQKPEIITIDQGGHFTNSDYIMLLEENEGNIFMNGKGHNVWIKPGMVGSKGDNPLL